MNVISISTDRNIFNQGSDVARRQIAYASSLESLHIIVFTKGGYADMSIGERVFVHPTNSRSRWVYLFDAIRIGKRLSAPQRITAQDPFECGLAGYQLAKHFGALLELQIHTDIGSRYFRGESLLNRIRFYMAHYLLPRAKHIRVVSDRIRAFLVERWDIPADCIEVRPVQVDTEAIKNAPIRTDLHKKYSQFRRIILMASRLTREKNITLALRAFALVRKKGLNAGLVVVGEGHEKKRLLRMVRMLGISEAVIFEPWTDDLTSYYKTADVFLNTSLYEGYGRTLVEASSIGLPIISTDVGIAEKYGATIVPMSDVSIAAAISTTVLP